MSSAEQLAEILSRHEALLLDVARRAIDLRVRERRMLSLDAAGFAPELQEPHPCFVTLHEHGELRGCMGCLETTTPLVEAVAHYAVQSALHDPRFEPAAPHELPHLHISLSVLSEPTPVEAHSQADLIAQLRPGIDGVTLIEGRRYSTLLPQVWEHIPDPVVFLGHLKRKAGLPENYWSPTLRFERYQAVSASEPVPLSADARL